MPNEWESNPYGMKANVEILRSMLDAFGVDKAVLIGNSAGGGVAVAFALEYPERIDELILVAHGVGGGYGPQFPGVGVAGDVDSAYAAPWSVIDAGL